MNLWCHLVAKNRTALSTEGIDGQTQTALHFQGSKQEPGGFFDEPLTHEMTWDCMHPTVWLCVCGLTICQGACPWACRGLSGGTWWGGSVCVCWRAPRTSQNTTGPLSSWPDRRRTLCFNYLTRPDVKIHFPNAFWHCQNKTITTNSFHVSTYCTK